MTDHLMERIEDALDIVEREHEMRQAAHVSDDYTNEMNYAFNTLIDARDEIKRLREAFLIAASCGEDGWGQMELWQTLEDAGIDCDALPDGEWARSMMDGAE